MAVKSKNRLIVIRDFFLNYDPDKYRTPELIKVCLGVWDSPAQTELSLKEMQDLRSAINRLIVQMSSDIHERKKISRTAQC